MKKLLALLLALMLLMSLAGCELLDYKNAMELYNAGQYADAQAAFAALGDYADSAAMAELSWQKGDYEAATQAFAARDFEKALSLYQGLGMYKDSPVKAIESQYLAGITAFDSGDYAAAIAHLKPLGSYEDCSARVEDARWLWLCSAGEQVSGNVYLRPQPDGTVSLSYHIQDHVLGVPYTGDITATLVHRQLTADFTAFYESTSSTVIREEAAGTLDLFTFSGTGELPVQSFRQTITDPDGTVRESTDPASVLMLRTILAQAPKAMAEALPELLAQSGADITIFDLGFTGLTQEETP